MKSMKMKEEINENRVGIYTQKSTEVTAVGDGLASKEIKSPVTETKDLEPNKSIESEENISQKDTKYKSNSLQIMNKYEIQEEAEKQKEQEKYPDQDKDLIIISDDEDVKSNHSSPTPYSDGLASTEIKSSVTETKDLKTNESIEREENIISQKDSKNKANSLQIKNEYEIQEEAEKQKEQEKYPDQNKDLIIISDDEDVKSNHSSPTPYSDGLAWTEIKSSVTETKDLKTNESIEREENIISQKDSKNKANSLQIKNEYEIQEEVEKQKEQEKYPDQNKDLIIISDDEDVKSNHSSPTPYSDGLTSKEIKSSVTETKDLKTNESIESEENIISQKDTENKANSLQIKNECEIQEDREKQKYQNQDKDLIIINDDEDVKSNHSSQTSFVRGAERDKLNKATKLQAFPRCEEYYGKERWDKALQTLEKIGYVNWEINTMFTALDKFSKKVSKRKSLEKEPPQKDIKKKARLDDDLKEEDKVQPGVISGILLKEKYSTFDLRANIGDASHPNFHILPVNRTKFYVEFYKFLRQEECFQDDPIVCSYFVNHTLMIECRNAQILEQIDKKICRLDSRLWQGAEFVMLPRSSERKNIKICIPYPYSVVTEILEIIKEQNRLPVEKWKVNNSEKWENGICLDVEVDGGTYLKLIQDQDDIFFLMKKATIKLPLIDESKKNVVQKNQDA